MLLGFFVHNWFFLKNFILSILSYLYVLCFLIIEKTKCKSDKQFNLMIVFLFQQLPQWRNVVQDTV